jgi:hypothetical protein
MEPARATSPRKMRLAQQGKLVTGARIESQLSFRSVIWEPPTGSRRQSGYSIGVDADRAARRRAPGAPGYQLSLEGPNGKPINDRGKDMAVWKKQSDGTWKMIADTFNSDLPSVAPVKSPEPKRGATKHHPSRKR